MNRSDDDERRAGFPSLANGSARTRGATAPGAETQAVGGPLLALSALILLLTSTPVLAQTVRWEDNGGLAAGRRGSLDLVFEDTEPTGGVMVPRVEGLTILASPSQQSSVSVVNGKASSSLTLSYPVRADGEGEITIPPFQVKTADGVKTVAGVRLEVGHASARRGAAGTDGESAAVTAEMKPSTRTPYAGEVFDVDLTVALAQGRRGEVVGTPSWEKQSIVAENWGDGKQVKVRGGGGVRLRARVLAPRAGTVELPPVQQEVRVESGRERSNPFRLHSDMFADIDKVFDDSFADSLFARAQMQEVTVESNGSAVDVRPLPNGAPAGFSGAVGRFELESKLVPDKAKTGEPVTWTLTLRGTGNWPGGVSLPPRAIPADVRTLQPKQQRSFAENSLFTGEVSEDLVLIPSQPGVYELDPVRFVYFNPETEKYETVTVTPPPLQVSGTALAASAATTAGGAGLGGGSQTKSGEPGQTTSSTSGTQSSLARATAPEPPSPADARLPREPQAGVGVALSPWPARTWHLALSLPFALLSFYWMLLALQRAWGTDPQRLRRAALKQLSAAIARSARSDDCEGRRAALLTWQHAASILLEIDFAAPTPAQLRQRAGIDGEWISLWSESDRALYGREGELDRRWHERARTLCGRLRRPRRNPLRAFLPHNLLPKIAAAALLLAIAAPAHADPLSDYAGGNFSAAREQWRAEAEAKPSNWVAHYNLGVAEAQLGDDGRALGETTAAFLGQPANDSARWNLGVFAARVPGIDRVLAGFATGAPEVALASLLSPATWQAVAIAGAFLFCLGGALLLRRQYGSAASNATAVTAVTALVAGAIVGLSAWACLQQYGHLADPDAALLARPALLHSVPTEAENGVQRPLEAGAVVVARKNFLGWTKVELPGGETGWIRGENLVPLQAKRV